MHSNSWDFLAAFLGQLSTLILSWSVFLGPGGCLAAHMPGSSDSPRCRQQQKPSPNLDACQTVHPLVQKKSFANQALGTE